MKVSRFLFIFFVLLSGGFATIHAQMGPPWTGSNFGYNYIFMAIDFPSNQNTIGYACGESLTYNGNGIVVKTTDGGATWTQMWTGAGRAIEGASFISTDVGYIAGWPKLGQGWSGFAKTTDGGTTWTSIPVTNDLYYFHDVVFKDENHGILLAQTNLGAAVFVTSNGGALWSQATGVAGLPFHACYVSGNTYYLVDSSGHIQKSTDGGYTWVTVFTQNGLLLTGIDCYNDQIIMACGDNGVIVKTNNGGNTWSIQVVGYDIWHDFEWESPERVFLVGTPGLVYHSTDGGLTWQNSYPQGAGGSALYECTFTADGHGFIAGSQGVELKRNPACWASFSTNQTATCTGQQVTFTNSSSGNVASNQWQFEGGTPPTSTDLYPVVVYSNPGTFDVKLRVSNQWWADSVTKTNYISVTQAPVAPSITANGNTLISNTASGNQWYRNGLQIAGATEQTYEATVSGIYWDEVHAGNCTSDTSNHIEIVMTTVNKESMHGWTIYPNPTKDKVFLSQPEHTNSPISLTIVTSSGLVVKKQEIQGKEHRPIEVDLTNQAPGVYFVRITEGEQTTTQKLIVH